MQTCSRGAHHKSRPLQGYSAIAYSADDGTANYHSLQISVNRRFPRDFLFGLAYTWSKAMDWTDTDLGTVNDRVPASLFRAWNDGLAGFDCTQVAGTSWVGDVPEWRPAMAPVGAVVATFSQATSINITASPSVSARILVNGDPYQPGSRYGPLQAFNPTVFSLSAVGTVGDPSKYLIRGPGLNNRDISPVKGVPIRERVPVQLRVERYNAFNHPQFNASGSQTNTQLVRAVHCAQDPHIVRWAVRLEF